MDLIVAHEGADLDALAAAVAASKLYPGATIALGRSVSAAARDFLALHKDRFPCVRFTDVDPKDVSRLVVVDTRRRSVLEPFGELVERVDRGEVEVHIYDHHRPSADDLVGSEEVIEPVGCATTLLCERMRERGIEPDSQEATLFLLGVYTDTGSLTFSSTTSRDAAVVAWLLDLGASLSIVNRYLTPAFDPAQRSLLTQILARVEIERIGSARIGSLVANVDVYVDSAADVVSEALRLENIDALIVVCAEGTRRVSVIARSKVAPVDVGRVLRVVGGGGHAGAASASLHGVSPEAIRRRVLDALRADPPRVRRVSDVMSSPVHTADVSTPLSALRDSLQAWRHTGVPVLREGKLVGIVSRRDLERAERAGRLHLPASSCMSHGVRTTRPDASIDEALDMMTRADVGRLPVLDRGRLVGIVTRTDLQRVLYFGRGAARPAVVPQRSRSLGSSSAKLHGR